MSSAVGVGNFGQSSGRHCAASASPVGSGERDGVGLGALLVDADDGRDSPESSDGMSAHPLPTVSVTTAARATAHRIARGPRRSIIRRT